MLSGSKMWSTNAHLADYGLCLARSNWDVPKHKGLSMIIVPLKGNDRVSLRQTRLAHGDLGDVCEEFFDDVVLPASNLVGDAGDGWSVAHTLMHHERNQTAGVGYGRLGGRLGHSMVVDRTTVAARLAAKAGIGGGSPHAQQIATMYVESVVGKLVSNRIEAGLALGTHEGPWGSLGKLFGSEASHRAARTAVNATGADGLVWDGDEVELDNPGTSWLTARVSTIGGGTSEIQRMIISERLLDLPREPSFDRDIPFREVLRNAKKF